MVDLLLKSPRLVAAAALLLLVSLAGFAHPGGLDASGCHINASTGAYHCHRQADSAAGETSAPQHELRGRVVAVTDGDTIKVLDGNNRTHRVRLIGIDAPERFQPFGNASRKNLEAMVAGQQVLVRSVKYDKYGRMLGDVWVQPRNCPRCDKLLYINQAQIQAGMAWWYRYYADEQSVDDRVLFESAERKAMAGKRGLWVEKDPVPPWVWRRR